MKLKKLSEIKETKKLVGTIPSGFKSDDSVSELLIVEPLIRHPELNLYRAIDPETGWKTWVEYTPETVAKPVDPQAEGKEEYRLKKIKLKIAKEDLNLGLVTQKKYDSLLSETKTLGELIGEL